MKAPQLLLVTLAGVLFAMGFAPFGCWPLSMLSLAVLFHCWQAASKIQALLLGMAFGVGQFGFGVSWIYVSMVNFGNLPPALAVIAVMLVTGFLALYPALAGLIFSVIKSDRQPFNLMLLAPLCWVVMEALRAYLFTGFPWLLLGYSTIDSWLVGFAPLGGVLLLSFIAGLVAGASVYLVYSLRRMRFTISLALAGALASVWLLGLTLQPLAWTQATGQQTRVGLIQLNISLQTKWQASMRSAIFDQYLKASATIANEVDLLIWPEGALPQWYDQISAADHARIKALDTAVALGTIERRRVEDKTQVYNALALLDQQGEQFYRKHHLVPFGEFFPLKWLLSGLLAQLQVPMSDMTSWPKSQAPLQANGMAFLATICYEDAFPEDWRADVAGADALLNISEDAWFGDSFAPHQRLEMARLRAIETGREMVRVSNSGMSTVIRSDGSYRQIAPQFEAVAMIDEVHAYRGQTPYSQWGRWPLFGLFTFILALRLLFFKAKANANAFLSRP